MRFPCVIMRSSLSLRRETIFSQRRDNIISAERNSYLRGETRISANVSGNTHYNPIRYCIHFYQAINILPHADTADLRRAHTLTLVCAIRRVISSALPYSYGRLQISRNGRYNNLQLPLGSGNEGLH